MARAQRAIFVGGEWTSSYALTADIRMKEGQFSSLLAAGFSAAVAHNSLGCQVLPSLLLLRVCLCRHMAIELYQLLEQNGGRGICAIRKPLVQIKPVNQSVCNGSTYQ
jgi:hypothetical protein